MSDSYVLPEDFGLSHENILIMVAAELGCVVETGWQKRQYVIKKPGPDDRYDKTLYCSARMEDDTVKVTGQRLTFYRFAFCDPKFFDKLGGLLNNEEFMMISSKDFDEPICNNLVF